MILGLSLRELRYNTGALFIKKTPIYWYRYPIIKLRRSSDRLMFIKNAYGIQKLLNGDVSIKWHIFQCMDKLCCVDFERVHFKFNTKYDSHTRNIRFLYTVGNLRALPFQSAYAFFFTKVVENIPCTISHMREKHVKSTSQPKILGSSAFKVAVSNWTGLLMKLCQSLWSEASRNRMLTTGAEKWTSKLKHSVTSQLQRSNNILYIF